MTIKAGDRVQWGLHSDSTPHTLVAVHGSEAWVKPIYYEGSGQIVPVSELVRIEPQPLTPLYEVGQVVKIHGKGEAVPIEAMAVSYATRNPILGLVWHREENLTPVPDVCPACKGSGKQEGSA